MKNTIVTAIYHYSYESRMGGRNYTFEFYENPFRNLLSLGANIIVYSHASEIYKIDAFFKINNFINYKIIEYDLNNYIFSDTVYRIKEEKNIIDKNGLIPGNSIVLNDRNTHLCLSKIDFLNMAISNNYFDSDNYYWIDAGLFHHALFPVSLGGAERYIVPINKNFWPENKNNLCTPELIDNLNKKNNNTKLLFIGITSYSVPGFWDRITLCDENVVTKNIHVIGGIFGGDKNEIMKMVPVFKMLTEQVFALNELTLEEDILSYIVSRNSYSYLKFDTWYHDIQSDPCYYGMQSDANCFYKLFVHHQ
jgi:hypothetical protein